MKGNRLLRAPRAPWVRYHNIIGMTPKRTWLGLREATGDGVVEAESARMPDVVSEIVVNSDHQNIHRHPKTIFEVRRILLAHLEDVRREYRIADESGPAENATVESTTAVVPAHVVSEILSTHAEPAALLSQSP